MRPKPLLARIFFLTCFIAASVGCSKPDYHTAAGTSGRFADAQGKWLFINYWAEWCKPCIEELPELHRFQQAYAERVVVLTVNYDGAQGAALQQQIAKLGIALPVLLEDPAPRLAVQRPAALPTTAVLAPDGKLHRILVGPQSVATLAAAIDSPADSSQPEQPTP